MGGVGNRSCKVFFDRRNNAPGESRNLLCMMIKGLLSCYGKATIQPEIICIEVDVTMMNACADDRCHCVVTFQW